MLSYFSFRQRSKINSSLPYQYAQALCSENIINIPETTAVSSLVLQPQIFSCACIIETEIILAGINPLFLCIIGFAKAPKPLQRGLYRLIDYQAAPDTDATINLNPSWGADVIIRRATFFFSTMPLLDEEVNSVPFFYYVKVCCKICNQERN
jgi:hypothetical protein